MAYDKTCLSCMWRGRACAAHRSFTAAALSVDGPCAISGCSDDSAMDLEISIAGAVIHAPLCEQHASHAWGAAPTRLAIRGRR